MVIIKNIKIVEDKLNSNELKKCFNYIKSLDIDPMSLLPKKNKYTVSFELSETNTEFANCIRRCLLDEIDVLSMNIDKIETNDDYILFDLIKERIEMVPINQELNYSTYKISLNIENKTDCIIDVKTKDFTIKPYSDNIFSNNVRLFKLESNCYIKIDDITITKGNALENSGKYSFLSNVFYKILDIPHISESNNKSDNSLLSNPTHFLLKYTTYGNISPKNVIIKCCDTLLNRLKNILNEIESIKSEKDIPYSSDLLDIKKITDILYIYIENEYWTLINLISKYVYLEDKNVPFVSPYIQHPDIKKGGIKIKHNQDIKILKNSIKKIILDLNKLYNKFK